MHPSPIWKQPPPPINVCVCVLVKNEEIVRCWLLVWQGKMCRDTNMQTYFWNNPLLCWLTLPKNKYQNINNSLVDKLFDGRLASTFCWFIILDESLSMTGLPEDTALGVALTGPICRKGWELLNPWSNLSTRMTRANSLELISVTDFKTKHTFLARLLVIIC